MTRYHAQPTSRYTRRQVWRERLAVAGLTLFLGIAFLIVIAAMSLTPMPVAP